MSERDPSKAPALCPFDGSMLYGRWSARCAAGCCHLRWCDHCDFTCRWPLEGRTHDADF